MNNRYLELSSTYRNRNRYPNIGQFEIPFSRSMGINGITAEDPILDAYSYYPAFGVAVVFVAGILGTLTPQLDANASTIDNFYINSIIEDVAAIEYRTIVSYNGTTQIATIDAAFTNAPVGRTYRIRRAIPTYISTLLAVTNATTVQLIPGPSSVDDTYNGYYLLMTNGPASGQIRRIIDYVGATLTVTVAPGFSAIPIAGNSYEILAFSRDNVQPLLYSGSIVSQNERSCYEIELITLILPNTTLYTSTGGLISMYPFVYVELSNMNNQNYNIIWSNNPNSTNAIFTCSITDVPNPTTSSFIKIDSDTSKQTIKFKPNDNLMLRVRLPDGNIYQVSPENMSPLPPDPLLQLSAVFSIKKL